MLLIAHMVQAVSLVMVNLALDKCSDSCVTFHETQIVAMGQLVAAPRR